MASTGRPLTVMDMMMAMVSHAVLVIVMVLAMNHRQMALQTVSNRLAAMAVVLAMPAMLD